MNTDRKKFEEWYTNKYQIKYPDITFAPLLQEGSNVQIREYFSDFTQGAWQAFEAAYQQGVEDAAKICEQHYVQTLLPTCKYLSGEIRNLLDQPKG